jgi:DUF4097 and DUF4098 domain-containing protein YvlB
MMIFIIFLFTISSVFAGGGQDRVREGAYLHEDAEKSLLVKELPMEGALSVFLDVSGSVRITASEKEEVSAVIYKYGAAIEEAVVEMEEYAEGLRIRSMYTEKPMKRTGGVDLDLLVPSHCNLIVETVGGDIEINGISGNLEGESVGGGNLIFSNLDGRISMDTVGGDILIQSSRLEGSVSTLGGDIILRSSRVDGKVNTLGGDLIFEGSVDGVLKAETLGGNIDVEDISGDAGIETLGGNIAIGRSRGHVNLETLGGDIFLREIGGSIHADTMGGDIEASLTGNPEEEHREVILDTQGGRIDLSVPDGAGMTVDITLKITAHGRKIGEILSDFDLVMGEREPTREERKKKIYRVITARGVIGNGEQRVSLSSVDGNITLDREQ